ncbi:MAG: PilZ domain-containing protein [Deltaproteobacteria bacterium]|nr:PilZ domain-containing protein [Deltaproteobacteria bacterium]MBW1718831.1 PilZ domain-containing protein [Deltaproteobacteria bacterium]MBW1931979.1 PilZ domain-containing protein [Deltaproteobacteria bacterium]MBW1937870.1 PilZ domain-containing protein [Deltaproteobacteria bacterium]MBW1964430.1 PilZ domain-containing protein [Deltaproteobacteria bacterium]
MDIIPGSNVDIVLDFDWWKEKIDVRRATVYDLNDKRMVLSQTAPPTARYNIGKKVKITYLLMEKDGWVRYGINGRLIENAMDYRLSGHQTVQAIIITPEPGREFFNLRLFYRLEPPLDCGLALFLKKEKMNILNISLGGSQFTHSKDYPIMPRNRLKLILQIDKQRYDIEAQALRVSSVSGRMGEKLEAIAVQFLNPDKKVQELLSIKIKDIERKIRYKESYAED